MNNKMKFGTAVGIVILAFLLGYVLKPKKEEVVYQKQSDIVTELRGYDIIRFKKIQQFTNNHPVYYSGVAMSCDGLGSCDSIYFESIAVPKIGPARFKMDYGSQGERRGWILVKN